MTNYQINEAKRLGQQQAIDDVLRVEHNQRARAVCAENIRRTAAAS